jgi:hypothetical protein
MSKLYWTTKSGVVIDVDEMSESHVRNAFKMLLREQLNNPENKTFELRGDMANEFNNSYPSIDAWDCMDDCDELDFPY